MVQAFGQEVIPGRHNPRGIGAATGTSWDLRADAEDVWPPHRASAAHVQSSVLPAITYSVPDRGLEIMSRARVVFEALRLQ